MIQCATGCGREAMVASLFCPGCSSAIAWRSTGRYDITMPERMSRFDPSSASVNDVHAPIAPRPRKTTAKTKK